MALLIDDEVEKLREQSPMTCYGNEGYAAPDLPCKAIALVVQQ